MTRAIDGKLYCITSYMGNKRFIECEDIDDLAEYIARQECNGYSVTSVTEVRCDGSKPRVAIKSNPTYKKWIKELTKSKVSTETDNDIQVDEVEAEKEYYVSYSGSGVVMALSEDEACERALNELSIDEINAYPMNEDGTLNM